MASAASHWCRTMPDHVSFSPDAIFEMFEAACGVDLGPDNPGASNRVTAATLEDLLLGEE